jgi:hypothetical protein
MFDVAGDSGYRLSVPFMIERVFFVGPSATKSFLVWSTPNQLGKPVDHLRLGEEAAEGRSAFTYVAFGARMEVFIGVFVRITYLT